MPKQVKVSIDKLLLDPNNPRFKSSVDEEEIVPEGRLEEKQEEVLSKFSTKKTDDDEEVTNVHTLYKSMTTIGYVPIDRIVITAVSNSKNFLVVEGNRRVATIKKIRKLMQERKDPFDKPGVREEAKHYASSFEEIDCFELVLDGLSKEERDEKTNIILGIRHHGSLLPWEPLPRAYNIYKEYMALKPKEEKFRIVNDKLKTIESMLSIRRSKIQSALKTYIAFLQLSELFEVDKRHFSLIEAGVTNSNLKTYFEIDGNSYKLSEEALNRMNEICEFETRDKANKNILPDPKAFGKFGRLWKMRMDSTDKAFREFVVDKIQRTLHSDSSQRIDIDTALDEATNFQNQRQWVKAVGQLLDKQEEQLSLSEYTAIGNEKGYKDNLKEALKPFRKIHDL